MIQVTSVNCPDCCLYEQTVAQFHKEIIQAANSSLYKYDIKLARANFEPDNWLDDKFKIDMLPFWIQIHKGKAHYFPNPKDLNRMIENIKRTIDPYQELTSLRLVKEFLGQTLDDVTGRRLVRVKAISMVSEPEDFEELFEDFKKAARVMSWREDVVFGTVEDSRVIKMIYEEYRSKFFPEKFDLNCIAVFKNKNRFEETDEIFLYDMNGGRKLGPWIAEKSLGVLEEMNEINNHAFPNDIPMMVAFVDPTKEAQTWNFLRDLRKIAEGYNGRITFVWVDYRDNMRLMIRMGVKDCK